MEYIIQVEKRIATMQSHGETVAYRRIGNKESLDITNLEPGQEMTFYFFKNNVLDTEVAIEKLNIVIP